MSTLGLSTVAHGAGDQLHGIAPATGLASRRYGVRVGGERLLLAGDGAVRVLELPPVYRLPNTRGWFLGVANVRGLLVPVYDLAAWLELAPPEDRRMLLVMGDDDAAAGVLVDTSPRHLVLAGEMRLEPSRALASALRPFAGDAFTVGEDTWTSLHWGELFDELKTLALTAS